MHTITSIGVINTKEHTHRQFALQAMEYDLDVERALTYELWKDGHLDLAEITSQRINTLINEMMYILKNH